MPLIVTTLIRKHNNAYAEQYSNLFVNKRAEVFDSLDAKAETHFGGALV